MCYILVMALRELLFGSVDLRGLDGDGALQWRADGSFRVQRCDGVTVRGVAGDAEAVAELLRRGGVLEADGSVYRARPNTEVVDFGWTSEASEAAADLDADFVRQLGSGRPDGLVEHLAAVAAGVPESAGEREILARARAAELNGTVPQVGSHRVFAPPWNAADCGAFGVEDAAMRGWATWAEWVPARLLTSTNAETWGDIDRSPRRDTIVQVAEWLRTAVSAGTVDEWLSEMFAHDPMLLHRLEGPAGPVYEVLRGTHRAHAARVWGLPWVLGRVHVERLARPLQPHTARMEALWEGLCRRGLLSATREGGRWYVVEAAAEWMLTPPAMATRWNAMYERVYPGALQAFTGLSVDVLCDAERWAAALMA